MLGRYPGRPASVQPLAGAPTGAAAADAIVLPHRAVVAREFEFTVADFERVRALIYQKAGISLSAAKQDMVYSRLARRLRAIGAKTFSGYLDHLEKGDKTEWELFINSLTTNLTSFFRESHHFPLLADHLRKQAGKHPLRIWCCASSTGEEPYSIAMTVADAFPAGHAVSVLASDIDTSVLATASAGVYPPDRMDKLDSEQIRRHFNRTAAGDYQVNTDLKRMISFQRVNLLEPGWPVRGPFDAIFCRNVMIYFDKPTQARILQRFVPLLQPDGILVAGHSESFLHSADLFRSIGKTVYVLAGSAR